MSLTSFFFFSLFLFWVFVAHMQVSPGSDCQFSQNVVAINTARKECSALGELNKLAVVSPDVVSILNSVIDLG